MSLSKVAETDGMVNVFFFAVRVLITKQIQMVCLTELALS